MERHWDIQPVNNEKVIRKRLDEGPQLCMILSTEIQPEYLYNMITQFYVFSTNIDDQEREVLLIGAYKGKIKEDTEKTKQAFGREIKEKQIYDDLVHIGETPFIPFCVGLDRNIIETMKQIYDIKQINVNSEKREAVCCYYYDKNNEPPIEASVIQLKPVIR